MIDVVGAENRARKLLQQVVLFVGGPVGADDADGRAALAVADFFQLAGGQAQRMFPGRGFQLAFGIAHQRLGQALGAVDKVEAEAALGAEKVAVDAALVAVVGADNLRAVVGLAHAQRHLAAVGAMRANGGDVVHLPGPRLVAIAAAGQRAHRANVDAHAALLAVELVAAVGRDDRADAAVLHAQRPHVHAFAAHAHAAVAEDAARTVIVDGRGPLLLFAMLLGFGVEALARAVLEGHVLQFALAAGIADRAVKRVVAEQQLNGGLARLGNFSRLGDEDLALGYGGGAGGLQLAHFFLAHHAHAAGGLEAEAGVVTESRNLDARLAAGVNQQRPRGSRQLLSIDCEGYVCHSCPQAARVSACGRETASHSTTYCFDSRPGSNSSKLTVVATGSGIGSPAFTVSFK